MCATGSVSDGRLQALHHRAHRNGARRLHARPAAARLASTMVAYVCMLCRNTVCLVRWYIRRNSMLQCLVGLRRCRIAGPLPWRPRPARRASSSSTAQKTLVTHKQCKGQPRNHSTASSPPQPAECWHTAAPAAPPCRCCCPCSSPGTQTR